MNKPQKLSLGAQIIIAGPCAMKTITYHQKECEKEPHKVYQFPLFVDKINLTSESGSDVWIETGLDIGIAPPAIGVIVWNEAVARTSYSLTPTHWTCPTGPEPLDLSIKSDDNTRAAGIMDMANRFKRNEIPIARLFMTMMLVPAVLTESSIQLPTR